MQPSCLFFRFTTIFYITITYITMKNTHLKKPFKPIGLTFYYEKNELTPIETIFNENFIYNYIEH